MKRNLRKMDEPPGKHPLFIPVVLQMITNALSPSLSLRTHTVHRNGAKGGVEERGEGEVDRQGERVFMSQCVTNKREKVAEGHTTKRPTD